MYPEGELKKRVTRHFRARQLRAMCLVKLRVRGSVVFKCCAEMLCNRLL